MASALWKPFTQMADLRRERPLVIARGDGRWLVTEGGQRLYDGVSSLWANVHGHRVPLIDRAVRRQLARVAHTTLLGATHRPAEDLARRLVRIAPKGLARVFFSDDGSTAVEAALKMAVQYHRQKPRPEPRRTRFLALPEAYHGDTLGAVGVGGIALFHGAYGPLVRRALRAPRDLAALERLLDRRGPEIAAFVFEPLVQGAAGMRLWDAAWLRRAAAACRRRGIPLIADEVATGFGRTGAMFACGLAGVRPDLMCVGKGLTGGYLPLAATLASERVYRAFLGPSGSCRTFFHGHTYTGNPLACAAAVANLDLMARNRVVEGVARRSEGFGRALAALEALPAVLEVRRLGFMAGIALGRFPAGPQGPTTRRMGHRVCLRCRDDGLLIRPLGDVVVLMPPLTATERELAWMVSVVRRAIVRECGA